MTDQRIDSSQPGSQANPEDLETVTPTDRPRINDEAMDRDDPPVADLARELPSEMKDAVRLEGDWAQSDEENQADDAKDSEQNLRNNG